MKNLFLSLSVLLIFACNNESDLNTPLNQTENNKDLKSRSYPIENEIDQMFYDYVNSSQFINYDLASKAFFNKLNINNSNRASFISSENIIDWISLNLSSTNFSSISSAQSEWDNIVNLKFEELQQFINITEFVISSPNSLSLTYYKKWVFGPYNTTNSPCQEEYNQCNNDADMHHMMNISYYMNSTTGKDTAEILTAVNKRYMADLHYCNHRLDQCLGLVD